MKRLEDVFKTSGIPTFTFVRPVEYTSLLVALRTPGRGVVVEGPSGIGKTTAVTRALDELGLSGKVMVLSSRRPKDVELIKELPHMGPLGAVLIDDFHRLGDDARRQIADLMKVLADEESKESKLVLVGINKAGESLVKFGHDLNNRLEVISLDANPDDRVAQLITQGEDALVIGLNIKQEIVAAANGSFYIAQMLSHQACLDADVLEEKPTRVSTKVSFESVKGKVFDRLSRTFMERTKKFARGNRFRREGRAPYFHLLHLLAQSQQWSLGVDQAMAANPGLSGSVTQIVEKGYLKGFIEGDSDLAAVLHFDSTSRILSIEDPQFVYFLRNISWSRFPTEIGFLSVDIPSRYDFALSFSGTDRLLAETLCSGLQDVELEVFYDKHEQHRILAADIEDYLRPIYQSDALFVVALLGPDYPKRIWTKFESDQFKQRFKDGAVIPIWFTTAPPGMFDETTRVGGLTFDPGKDLRPQVAAFVEILSKKIADTRGGK